MILPPEDIATTREQYETKFINQLCDSHEELRAECDRLQERVAELTDEKHLSADTDEWSV